MSISRRHFLLCTGSVLGACLLPPAFLRRLARFSAEPAAAIDAPSSPRHILYATPKDDADDRWQLALGRPTTEYPSAPSWREWLGDHESGERRYESFVDSYGQKISSILSCGKFGCVVEGADQPPDRPE